MSIQIELPDDLQQRLAVEAARLNLSISEYALQILDEKASLSADMPKNGSDLVRYWHDHGLIGTLKTLESSADIARRLRAMGEQRTT